MKGSYWEWAWLPGSYRPLEGVGWPIIRDQESELQLEAHRSSDYGQGPQVILPAGLSTLSHFTEADLGRMKCSVQAWGVLLLQSLNIHLKSLHLHSLNNISSMLYQQSHSLPPKSLLFSFFFAFLTPHIWNLRIKNNKSSVLAVTGGKLLGELAFIVIATEGSAKTFGMMRCQTEWR